MKRRIVFAGLALCCWSSLSIAQVALYDDFSTPHILPHLWKTHENLTTSLDVVRGITGSQLQLALTTFGVPGTSGATEGVVGVTMRQSAGVRQIETNVTVQTVRLEDCPTSVHIPAAFAEIGGTFFNDGTSTGPKDLTGDIRAVLAWEADFGDVTSGSIVGTVSRCITASCAQQKLLRRVIFTGMWTRNVVQRGVIVWVPANKVFVMRLNPGKTVEAHTLSYATIVGTPNAPVDAGKFLRVRNAVSKCSEEPLLGSIGALFDTVRATTPPAAAAAE